MWLLAWSAVGGILAWCGKAPGRPAAAGVGAGPIPASISSAGHPTRLRHIEEIQVGDYVLAKDPSQVGPPTPHKVIATPRNWTERVIHLKVNGTDDELQATPSHPFWTRNRGWVPAEDLEAGDFLEDEQGQPLRLTKVWQERRTTDTFNLTVEGLHTYYVSIGDDGALVHNTNPNAPGYWNYQLVDKSGTPYYTGMAGPGETIESVTYRHETRSLQGGSSPGRFVPGNGDDIARVSGERVYADARRMEHELTIRDDTYIGRDGNNYRGNRQSPIGERNAGKYYEEGAYPSCSR